MIMSGATLIRMIFLFIFFLIISLERQRTVSLSLMRLFLDVSWPKVRGQSFESRKRVGKAAQKACQVQHALQPKSKNKCYHRVPVWQLSDKMYLQSNPDGVRPGSSCVKLMGPCDIWRNLKSSSSRVIDKSARRKCTIVWWSRWLV